MPTARINNHNMYFEVLGRGEPVLCMGVWGTFERAIPGAKGLLWEDVAHVVAGKEQKIRCASTLFEWLASC